LRYLLPNLSEKMHYQLGRAFSFAQRSAKNGHYTLEQLLYAVRQTGEGKKEATKASTKKTRPPARWSGVCSSLGNSRIFHDFENLELDELFKPGQCTVIQLNEVDRREQQVIVATLLRRVYQARMETAKGKVDRGDRNYSCPIPSSVCWRRRTTTRRPTPTPSAPRCSRRS
jgi:hypothetical protein